jgi:hypothetical protein
MPPKKSIKSPEKQSKTAFVLSQSVDVPASDVVAAGKAIGIDMSPAYVHSIRSSAKRKKGAKRQAGRPKGSKNKSGGPGAAAVSGLKKAEAQLLEWILEHGTPAVQRMVDGVNDRIRKLM